MSAIADEKPPSLNAAPSEASPELPSGLHPTANIVQRRRSDRPSNPTGARPIIQADDDAIHTSQYNLTSKPSALDSYSSLDLTQVPVVSHLPAVRRRSDRPSNATGVRPSLTDVEEAHDTLSAMPTHVLAERVSRRSEMATVRVSLENGIGHAPVFDEEDGVMAPPSYGTTPAISVQGIAPMEIEEGEISEIEAKKQRLRGTVHFVAICWAFVLNGWNDGTTGPLIPVMQAYYNVNFTIVSLIFVANTVGYITGSLSNVYLNERLGFGKVVVLGAILQTITYTLQAPAGPFPLMIIAYVLGGYGIALQNGQGCGFVGSLHDPRKMGILHASYGIGAFSAPLLSTFFATQAHWSFHYIVSTGLSLINVISLLTVFRLRTQDQIMADAGIAPVVESESGANNNRYRAMVGLRVLHFLALFSLIYVGTEVTLGGWIVTYIIEERKGGSSAGYISSGFFGGLALGRIALMWLNRLVGEHRIMYIYVLAAISLEVTVWFVPSLIGNAVAISFIGLLLGPMYPILMNHSARILPRWLLTGSMGLIGGIGQAGSALLPFITGVIAAREGIVALQPLLISMMGCLVILWFIIPKGHSRTD